MTTHSEASSFLPLMYMTTDCLDSKSRTRHIDAHPCPFVWTVTAREQQRRRISGTNASQPASRSGHKNFKSGIATYGHLSLKRRKAETRMMSCIFQFAYSPSNNPDEGVSIICRLTALPDEQLWKKAKENAGLKSGQISQQLRGLPWESPHANESAKARDQNTAFYKRCHSLMWLISIWKCVAESRDFTRKWYLMGFPLTFLSSYDVHFPHRCNNTSGQYETSNNDWGGLTDQRIKDSYFKNCLTVCLRS